MRVFYIMYSYAAHFFGEIKVTALGVYCVALLCCLFDFACFFLPSFSSLIKNIYTRFGLLLHTEYVCINCTALAFLPRHRRESVVSRRWRDTRVSAAGDSETHRGADSQEDHRPV